MRVGELAKATGISVRTLHHYDDMGLLRPSRRTEAGHRLYTENDVERLHQIVCLRALGLSLEEIRLCLDRDRTDLRQVLEGHRNALTRRIAAEQRLRRRIDSLLALLRSGASLPLDKMLKTIEETTNMFDKYWTPEQMEAFRKRAEALGPEAVHQAKADWAELIPQVRAVMDRGDDPASPHVRALAERWQSLRHMFSGGDPQIEATLRRLHADGFAQHGDQGGHFVDPAMIAYVNQALPR